MSTAIATRDEVAILEQVVMGGDLSALTGPQRLVYVNKVCESRGLNPLTKPFLFLRLNNKLVLYATRDCTDQLRKIDKVSITISERDLRDDIYVVTARARDGEGREDESTGVVSIAGLKGEFLANMLMKAETKAKRRVTLSICGLGWLDETEIDSIPNAERVEVDMQTGEIMQKPKPAPKSKGRPKAKPSSGETPTCSNSDCGKILEPRTPTKGKNAGKTFSVAHQVAFTTTEYGQVLCLECSSQAKDAKEKAAVDGQATNEPGEDDWVQEEAAATA